MVTALALLAFAQPLALTLEVPKSVVPGDEVVATLWAENKGPSRLILVKPNAPSYSLGFFWSDSLQQNHKPFARDQESPLMGQWIVGREIDTTPFLVLKPGDRVPLYREKFTKIFSKGVRPNELSEMATAPRESLPEGKYRLQLRYGFDRSFDKKMAEEKKATGWASQKLTKSARALYLQTWTGAIDVSAEFDVTSKESTNLKSR